MEVFIPATLSIKTFFHCRKCIAELPPGRSPQNYRRYDIGFTDIGVQVWCTRHNCNVVHIHFEGQKHPANMETLDG